MAKRVSFRKVLRTFGQTDMRYRFFLFWLFASAVVFDAGIGSFAADESNSATVVDPDHAAKRTKGLEIFKSSVRAVLKQKCVQCHGGDSTEAKLDLATQEGLFKGGDRGPAAVIGHGSKSLLTRLIAHQQEPQMPKDDDPLSPNEIASIVKWIDLGAPYDEPLVPKKADANDWINRQIPADAKKLWSFQPLKRVAPPSIADRKDWGHSPIDQFVLSKQLEAKLYPNESAAPETLIRRAYFDLIGLPPSVEDIDAFVADDRPDAYERLIDRLLASPHYGERWGRRWLDLARFAESHGFEHDYDRSSAFHFRDFVVQALNQGMPYNQFIQWQIAGDEIAPDDRLAMMATGYLAAGVHSTQITKNEVEKHRYDEMDDMLSTIGTSLLGLTIGCARCHDHKFDPIPQADYYRLLSTFTTTIRSEVELDFDPEGYQRAKSEFDRNHEPYEQAVRVYERDRLPIQFADWYAKRDLAAENSVWILPQSITYKSEGKTVFTQQPDATWLVSGPNPDSDVWTITFDTKFANVRSIRLEALADPSLPRSGPGRGKDGNFVMTDVRVTVRPLGETDITRSQSVKLVAAKATFEQNGFSVADTIDDDPKSGWAVDPEFGKDHAAVFTTNDPFGFENGTSVSISVKFQRNDKTSIGRARLSLSQGSDLAPTTANARPESIQAILRTPIEKLSADERNQVLDWYKRIDTGWVEVDKRRAVHAAEAPKPRVQKVLVATEGLPPVKLHTQAESEFLKETHFLRRGETNNKVAVASQNFLQVLMANTNAPQLFQVPPPSGWRTSYQRTSLTNWLTDCEVGAGSLLARVITNRLWQHHVGQGIVVTPSDFGTRGELPTHPELLDWLSTELVRHHWELKPLHRMIISSSTYRQSSDTDESRAMIDRENKLIWHRPRRRLEAEIIRDAILSVSDTLDDRLYGPGQLDEGHQRRSLYFTVKRSQLIPSMTVFDAPDGTTPVAERQQTTVTPQALLLMNNPQVRQAAHHFAARLLPVATKSTEQAVRVGYLLAIGRSPTPAEQADAVTFLREQANPETTNGRNERLSKALTNFCQVLFCLNEFIYSD